ncbi:MAG: WecB/TagA/CpsF family glycosyltransferase [Nitrospirae bacterium]|nr:WecB/TagA/CpsF family glycosyltransferase [Nitrospirota bacterium]
MLAYIEERIIQGKKSRCIPLNLTKYVFAKKDPQLRDAVNSSDLIIADGVPIVWLSRRLGYDSVQRVTGIDLAEALMTRSKAEGWRLFVFGASPMNLKKAVDNFQMRFAGLQIVGTRHGYFKAEETPQIVKQINQARPDILFLGLGMPQKEYFIHRYQKDLNVGFCLTIGGAIDVWAGVKQRTPKAIQKVGLEWLYRSIYDKSKALNILKYGFIFLKDMVFAKK